MKQSRSLTEGSISRGLFQFAAPILCTNLLQSLNGSFNSVLVGRYLGEAALTAVSNAQLLIFVLTGAALGIAMAAMILVGQCIGANNLAEAKRVVGTSATFFAGIAVVMAAAGVMLSEPLLHSMGVPSASRPLAVSYMRVMFLALPSMYMYVFVVSILRSAGDSRIPLYSMLLTVALGVVLSPVLIFGWGPFPEAGVAGSALATFVAHTVSLVVLVVYLYRSRYPLCLQKNDLAMLRADRLIVRTLVRKGIPMSAQVLVVSLSSVLMIVLANRFGVHTSAAFGASLQIWTYLQMPALAVGMAVAGMAALNVGGQQWDRVRAIARVGVIYSILLTGSMLLLLYALDTHLYQLFLPAGSPALPIISHINAVVAWSFVFLGVSIVLLGVVRAAGAVMMPLFVHTFTLLGVRFPLAIALMDRWQADGVWWSFPISSVLAVVLAAVYYKRGAWQSAFYQNAATAKGVPTASTRPTA